MFPARLASSIVLIATLTACGTPGKFSKSDELRLALNREFDRITKESVIDQIRNEDLTRIIEESRRVFPEDEDERPGKLLYFEEAKAYSALGWNYLRDGKPDAAEIMYRRANEVLVEGDRAYGEFYRKKIESAKNQATFLAVLSTVAAGVNMAAGAPGAALSQNIASYLTDNAYITNARAQMVPQDPEVSLLRGQSPESDGRRIIVIPTSGPLMNHGKLIGYGSCTGGLVGYRLFVTNAHCVHGPDARPLAPDQLSVRFDGLTKIDAVRAIEVHVAPEYEPSPDRYGLSPEFTNDWAILVFDRHPHGRGFYGVVRDIASLPQGLGKPRENIFLAGFSGNLNDGRLLSLDWGCTMTIKEELRQGWTNCRGAPGSSGSPILLTSSDLRFHNIVALQAFGREPGDNAITGGGPLSSQFYDKLAELRERIGLPNGPYPPVGPDGVLPSSKAIGNFESASKDACRFAGRFINSGKIWDQSVNGNQVDITVNGSSASSVIVDRRYRVRIEGRETRGEISLASEDDWDFLYGIGGWGGRFLHSRVGLADCR